MDRSTHALKPDGRHGDSPRPSSSSQDVTDNGTDDGTGDTGTESTTRLLADTADPAPKARPAPAAARRASPLDPVSSLLLESSLELVSSLRDPLNAIAFEAENLALAAAEDDAGRDRERPRHQAGGDAPGPSGVTRFGASQRMGERARGGRGGGGGVRGSVRSHRLQRQIASVSRAITMLERVLRESPRGSEQCDLTRIAKEACCFLRAYAARNGHRLLWDERATEPAWIEASERAARLTLVVAMAERLLALPDGADLSVSVRTDPTHDAIQVELQGGFQDMGRNVGDPGRQPAGLERLLSSESIAEARAHVHVESPQRLSVRFQAPAQSPVRAQADHAVRAHARSTVARQAGDLDPLPAQAGPAATARQDPTPAQLDGSAAPSSSR